jgi:hypothetical protein
MANKMTLGKEVCDGDRAEELSSSSRFLSMVNYIPPQLVPLALIPLIPKFEL